MAAETAGPIGLWQMLAQPSRPGTNATTTMTISTVVGTIIPILLKKLHIDPAVASGPFISTLNDICAVVIYYGLATLLFVLW